MNPNVGLKISFQILTQLKTFTFGFVHIWVCPYFTQIWVQTTQQFFRVREKNEFRVNHPFKYHVLLN